MPGPTRRSDPLRQHQGAVRSVESARLDRAQVRYPRAHVLVGGIQDPRADGGALAEEAQVRADTASPHNWELAFRKAYTARTFRRTSLDWRDRTAGDAEASGQRALANVIPLGGGVPIMMGDEPLGGVGVSGAGGGQSADSACAAAGVAAIADELE